MKRANTLYNLWRIELYWMSEHYLQKIKKMKSDSNTLYCIMKMSDKAYYIHKCVGTLVCIISRHIFKKSCLISMVLHNFWISWKRLFLLEERRKISPIPNQRGLYANAILKAINRKESKIPHHENSSDM